MCTVCTWRAPRRQWLPSVGCVVLKRQGRGAADTAVPHGMLLWEQPTRHLGVDRGAVAGADWPFTVKYGDGTVVRGSHIRVHMSVASDIAFGTHIGIAHRIVETGGHHDLR